MNVTEVATDMAEKIPSKQKNRVIALLVTALLAGAGYVYALDRRIGGLERHDAVQLEAMGGVKERIVRLEINVLEALKLSYQKDGNWQKAYETQLKLDSAKADPAAPVVE